MQSFHDASGHSLQLAATVARKYPGVVAIFALTASAAWAVLPFTQPPIKDRRRPKERCHKHQRQDWRAHHDETDPPESGFSVPRS